MNTKELNRYIASLPGVRDTVRDNARDIRDTARVLALGHGTLPDCINLDYPNEYDIDVVMEHEAALSIEFGHDDAVFDSGWVPGLHIMRDAAHLT